MRDQRLDKQASRKLIGVVTVGILSAAHASGATAGSLPQEQAPKPLTIRVPFIENRGQLDEAVLFYTKTSAGTVIVTRDGLTSVLATAPPGPARQDGGLSLGTRDPFLGDPGGLEPKEPPQPIVLRERFVRARRWRPSGLERAQTTVDYMIGPRERWRSDLPTYRRVSLGEVWAGVDVELQLSGAHVEKVFTVRPGARVEDIKVAFEPGPKRLQPEPTRELTIETEAGTAILTQPRAFQEIGGRRLPVDVAYTVDSEGYGFAVGAYDPEHALVIDPLIASTYVGGAGFDVIDRVFFDGDDLIVVGRSTTSDLYGATGYVGGGCRFCTDIFVAVFKADLTLEDPARIGYLGGDGQDVGRLRYRDADGRLYFAGFTNSSDFPDSSPLGGGDAIALVVEITASGINLLHSRRIGGDGVDFTTGILHHPDNDYLYVVGSTTSAMANFNISTTGKYQEDLAPQESPTSVPHRRDAFVARLQGANDPSDPLAGVDATYAGGRFLDQAGSNPVVDAAGNVYVEIVTYSDNLFDPPFTGTFSPNLNRGGPVGPPDGGVLKFNADLTDLLAGTYLGGEASDFSSQLMIDDGALLVLGVNRSADFLGAASPTVFNLTTCAPTALPCGGGDAYLLKLPLDLTTPTEYTVIGGAGSDSASNFVRDPNDGNFYLAGRTNSTDFYTSAGAYDRDANGGSDVYLARLSSDRSEIYFSTLFGGDQFESGFLGLNAGYVYVVGDTASMEGTFPLDGFDEEYGGEVRDGFLASFTRDFGADTDGDGISDIVDKPMTVGQFSKGSTTGEITTAGDQLLTVSEEPGDNTVRITARPTGGATAAEITLSPTAPATCNTPTMFKVNAGDDLLITCSSVTAEVLRGPVRIDFVRLDGSVATTELPTGYDLTFDANTDTFTAPATNPDVVVITFEDGTSLIVSPGEEIVAVSIDVKPGSDPNSINLGSGGNVPVAIFSTPAFDATTIDPATVTLASAPAKLKGNGSPNANQEDVNGDGLLDLVVHVTTEALELTDEDTEAVLEGETFEGRTIRGVDTIHVVP